MFEKGQWSVGEDGFPQRQGVKLEVSDYRLGQYRQRDLLKQGGEDGLACIHNIIALSFLLLVTLHFMMMLTSPGGLEICNRAALLVTSS